MNDAALLLALAIISSKANLATFEHGGYGLSETSGKLSRVHDYLRAQLSTLELRLLSLHLSGVLLDTAHAARETGIDKGMAIVREAYKLTSKN